MAQRGESNHLEEVLGIQRMEKIRVGKNYSKKKFGIGGVPNG